MGTRGARKSIEKLPNMYTYNIIIEHINLKATRSGPESLGMQMCMAFVLVLWVRVAYIKVRPRSFRFSSHWWSWQGFGSLPCYENTIYICNLLLLWKITSWLGLLTGVRLVDNICGIWENELEFCYTIPSNGPRFGLGIRGVHVTHPSWVKGI